jgi:hypothetical protein
MASSDRQLRPAIPNSKFFDDDVMTIDRYWWGWAGLFDTYCYKSRLARINPPLRDIRIGLNLELLSCDKIRSDRLERGDVWLMSAIEYFSYNIFHWNGISSNR